MVAQVLTASSRAPAKGAGAAGGGLTTGRWTAGPGDVDKGSESAWGEGPESGPEWLDTRTERRIHSSVE